MKKLVAIATATAVLLLAGCNAEQSAPLHQVVTAGLKKEGKKNIILVRYNTQTGAAAVSRGEGWKTIQEAGAVTPSAYTVVVQPTQDGKATVVRLDENTGKTWILQKSAWAEMKEGAADVEDEAEQPAAEGEKADKADGEKADGEKADGEKGEKKKKKKEE